MARVEATIAAFQLQLTRIESKVGDVEREVAGHGKWMHTLKTFAVILALLLGWVFVNAIWPWLKPKIGIPA